MGWEERADEKRAFDPAFLPALRRAREGVENSVGRDVEYARRAREMPADYGKVEFCVRACAGGEGIRERGERVWV